MPAFNVKVSISSSNFVLSLLLYNTIKEDIVKQFGKDAVVFHQFNDKQARNGCYYGDLFVNISESKTTSGAEPQCAP